MIRPIIPTIVVLFLSGYLYGQKKITAGKPVELNITAEEVGYQVKEFLPSKDLKEDAYSNVTPAGTPVKFPVGEIVSEEVPAPVKIKVNVKYHFPGKTATTLSDAWKFNDGFVQNITRMDVEQGFHSPNTAHIAIDSAQNAWATSSGMGLNIFDGKFHYNFHSKDSPVENYLHQTITDKAGNAWILSGQRLLFYNGKYFIEYVFPKELKGNAYHNIFIDSKGLFWMNTYGGDVVIFDGTDFFHYKGNANAVKFSFRNMSEDPDGACWLTSDTGIMKFEKRKDGSGIIHHYRNTACFKGVAIRGIKSDASGILWITSNHGLLKLDHRAFYRYDTAQGLHSNDLHPVAIDQQNRVWMGTGNKGVSMFDGHYFYRYDQPEGYSSGHPTLDIEIDFKGNAWATAGGDGLYRINQLPFSNYNTGQKIPGDAIGTILAVGTDSLWVGTNNGKLICISKGIQRLYDPTNGFPGGSVRALMRDSKGHIWIGYWGAGMVKYDGKRYRHYTFGNGAILAFAEDHEGNIWMGTSGDGIYCLKGDKLLHYDSKGGLPGKSSRRICTDHQGNVWMNLYGAGVLKFSNGKFFQFSDKQGLLSKSIGAVFEDSRHDLWFGSGDKGLFRFDGKTITHYTSDDGLPNDKFWGIVEDQKGRLWFTTEKGISRGEWVNEQFQFQNFAWNDGVRGLEYYNNSISSGVDGKLYFGSGKGMAVFDSRFENPDQPAPRVKINGVSLSNTRTPWNTPRFVTGFDTLWFSGDSFLLAGTVIPDPLAERGISYTDVSPLFHLPIGLTLPWNENHLNFSFIGNDWGDEHTVQYTYMLAGFDEKWCLPVKKSDVEYINLAHGDYVFMVKAVNRYGKESSIAKFAFTILPPWWKTWWFYSMEFMAIVAVIWQIIRYREKTLLQRNIRLESTVAERTYEVTKQKSIVETKNKEILDSINYAQRIQQAILHPEQEIREAFSDAFVIFKPKDIVSGDFYWFAESKYNKIIAVADCTGHGVPGGFMSMLGYEILQDVLLQEAVETTSEALSQLDKRVTNTLNKSSKQHRDGMDMVLCAFSASGNKLQYSGANRPLVHISQGEIKEYKPDKHTIGGAIDNVEKKFRNIEIEIRKGDIFYLFTDGFADQFGGEKGKKFKYKNLIALLKSVSSLPLYQQKQMLEQAFETWKGDLEQLDDVCVIGIQV